MCPLAVWRCYCWADSCSCAISEKLYTQQTMAIASCKPYRRKRDERPWKLSADKFAISLPPRYLHAQNIRSYITCMCVKVHMLKLCHMYECMHLSRFSHSRHHSILTGISAPEYSRPGKREMSLSYCSPYTCTTANALSQSKRGPMHSQLHVICVSWVSGYRNNFSQIVDSWDVLKYASGDWGELVVVEVSMQGHCRHKVSAVC